jgi:Flp pilus assembly protein TadG
MSGAAVGIVNGEYYFDDYEYQHALDLAWEEWYQDHNISQPIYKYFDTASAGVDNALYGISVKNADGYSLISSDIETPHFAGYADHIGTVLASNNKVENYNPQIISAAEKAQIAQAAVDLVIPIAEKARVDDATAAGADALTASIILDGTTVSGNITTIRSTSALGIVTTTTITAVTTTIQHAAVTSTDPITQVVTIITPAYTTTSTSNVTSTYVNPVSVIKAAYDASYLASKGTYDLYIETTRTDYIGFVDEYNAGVPSSIAFNIIGKSHIHTFRTPGITDVSPLFFINPTSSDDSYGVLRQYFSGGYWNLDVIQSGDDARAPNILVFKLAKYLPSAPSNEYGIVTYLKDGTTVAFDSRRKPLAILAAPLAASPTIPCNGDIAPNSGGLKSNGKTYGWNDKALDFDFRCDRQKTTVPIPAGFTIAPENVMFCVPALTEAVYSRVKKGYKDSKGQIHKSTAVWWVMYHQTYSVRGNTISAGWCVYKSDFTMDSIWSSGGLFGGDGGHTTKGTRPYPDKTVNQITNTILISDKSYYL